MTPYSATRRLIATVLTLELAAALALTWVAAAFEGHTRFRAFDMALAAQASTLFGAVGDSDDAQDDVMLDMHSVSIPPSALFDVETARRAVLGRSAQWPTQIDARIPSTARDGIYTLTINDRKYRVAVLHAVRVVDPGEKGGGVAWPVTVRYGAPTAPVWHEVREAARFYALASLCLLTLTGLLMAWVLRRTLAPLAALADEASRITGEQWRFDPPPGARAMAELAPLTQALELTLKRLERSFAQQKRFTSDAAHELKTDLATIKSSLQLLAMRRRSPQEYEQGLEVCLADALRMEQTVMDMLTLARVEYAAGRRHEAPASADLAACLVQEAARFESFAQLHGLRVELHASDAAYVRMSEHDGRLLCANLLLNALQHSDCSTSVTAALHAGPNGVSLAIENRGHGISPEALPHIFEPFYRGDAARDRRQGSTGLGLAISQGICRQAGGSITVESTTGAVTVVRVHLPLADVPSEVLSIP